MTLAWSWPQFVMAALIVFGSAFSLAKFGQKKTDSHGWWEVLFGPVICAAILYAGGFWTPCQ